MLACTALTTKTLYICYELMHMHVHEMCCTYVLKY